MAESIKETDELHDVSDREEIEKYTMSVAEMLTGVATHRIRRFGQTRMLKPRRTVAGQRWYSDDDIELIKNIARLGGRRSKHAGSESNSGDKERRKGITKAKY